MAAEWDESCLDMSVSDYDSNSIIRLQAVCRGWLVRKKLKDIQTEFQQIVLELDGPTTKVEWTDSALPHPVIRKLSKKTRKNQNQMSTRKQSIEGEHTTSNKLNPVTESACPKCTEKSAVGIEAESVVERSVHPVTSKPNAAEKFQSDQQVQTEFSQTSQQRRTSEETHTQEDKKCQPAVMDSLPPHRDVCEKDDHFQTQDSTETDSMTTLKNLKVANNEDEHHRVFDANAARDNTHVSFPVSSDIAASSTSVRSSPQVVVSSESLAGVTGPASEFSGMRRVDSFHGDQTSVWDSSSSVLQDQESGTKRFQGQHNNNGTSSAVQEGPLEMGAEVKEVKLRSLNTEELLKQRQNVAMELLWVQQAIISRKKYLKLKLQMDGAA